MAMEIEILFWVFNIFRDTVNIFRKKQVIIHIYQVGSIVGVGDVTIGYFWKLRSWIGYGWMYDFLATISEFEHMVHVGLATCLHNGHLHGAEKHFPTDVQCVSQARIIYIVSFSNTSVDTCTHCGTTVPIFKIKCNKRYLLPRTDNSLTQCIFILF